MIRRVALMAWALTIAACGDPSLDSVAEHATIVDGEVTTNFGAVVAITPRRIRCDDSPSVLCSGILVAPDAVLSAAHCFVSMRPGLAYEVFVGDSVGPGAHGIGVVTVATHPDFDEATRDNDVAVLWLATPVDGISPAALPAPTSAAPEVDDRVELVGFGATGPGTAPDGMKRVGIGRVGLVATGTVSVDPDPSVSCVGDSGGPLLTSGGTLIAVASSGDTGCRETSVYALIAPTVEGFLDPTLQMGPRLRPPALDACGGACVSDDECPVGFVCVPSPDAASFYCALPGQEAGMLTSGCRDDSTCGAGFCAVGAPASDCRCYEPCDSVQANPSSGGCGVRQGTRRPFMWLLALSFLISHRRTRGSWD